MEASSAAHASAGSVLLGNKRSRDTLGGRQEEKDGGGEECGELSPGDDRKPSPKWRKKAAPPTPSSRRFFRTTPLTCEYSDWCRTNDEIHSSIDFGPVLRCLIDTRPVQRLRGLKQLGAAEFVYCNASHSRFEHSLGVAHLARQVGQHVRQHQRGLRTTTKDVLCVELAGLCHDLGHGPFSHVFEQFLKRQKKRQGPAEPCGAAPGEEDGDVPQQQQQEQQQQQRPREEQHCCWPERPAGWTHEDASLVMLDAALAQLGLAIDLADLDAPLKQIGDGIDASTVRDFGSDREGRADEDLLTSRDFVFVKECIYGKPVPAITKVLGGGFHGRTEEHQEWLYDVVHNRHSGLDVDKVDYYARDQRRAFGESGEIDKVMIHNPVVAWAACTDPRGSCAQCAHRSPRHRHRHLMICYPEKMVASCAEFFKTRHKLHTLIYKHKTTIAASLMITDILCQADSHFLVPIGGASRAAAGLPTQPPSARNNYRSLPLSRVMCDPRVYVRMKDSIIDQIAMSPDPELSHAQALIDRLQSRDLYKCVASKPIHLSAGGADERIWRKSDEQIARDLLKAKQNDPNVDLTLDDIIVQKVNMHHGQKEDNPLMKMRFVEKCKLNKAKASDYHELPEADLIEKQLCDSLLPSVLQTCCVRVYCRDPAKFDVVSQMLETGWGELQSEMAATAGPNAAVPEPNRIAFLTQDTDDEGGCEDEDNSSNNNNMELSPVPNRNPDDGTRKSITPPRLNRRR